MLDQSALHWTQSMGFDCGKGFHTSEHNLVVLRVQKYPLSKPGQCLRGGDCSCCLMQRAEEQQSLLLHGMLRPSAAAAAGGHHECWSLNGQNRLGAHEWPGGGSHLVVLLHQQPPAFRSSVSQAALCLLLAAAAAAATPAAVSGCPSGN